MNMEKKLKNRLIFVAILTLLFMILLFIKNSSNNTKIAKEKDLLAIQNESEKDFKTNGYTLENPNIILNPYEISPLTALILFETPNEERVSITVKGKDKHTTFNNTFENTKKHYIPVYGLYPDSENEIILEYGNNSKTIYIETEKLPDDFILPISVKVDKTKLDNQLYFFTPASVGYTAAYDINGDVRWYLTKNASWEIERLDNGNILLSTERLLIEPYYTTGMYEMNLLGKIFKEYKLQGGYHHDYFEMENGNFLVATCDPQSVTVEDIIVELDRETGEIIKQFDLKDILNQEDGKSESWSSRDWFHNNSVWYDKKTNSITLSGRHKDAVINFDYSSGKLNWIIGDSTNWDDEYQKYFFKPVGELEWQWSQHSAKITPEGYVFIFDNGNNKSKIEENYVPAIKSYSRGVMYEIDTNEMTIKQIWQYGKEKGSDFYSPYISEVDYLDKNHYLVHSGGIVYKDGVISNYPAGLSKGCDLVSHTVEILNDKEIFEIKLPTNNYRAEKMDIYNYSDSNINFSNKELGIFSKTKIDSNKLALNLTAKEIPKEYNVSFIAEKDRLSFSGDFNENDDVKLILNKGFINKLYKIALKEEKHEALCIDIFSKNKTDDKVSVTKFINYRSLFGRYNLYVEINGKVYNTKQHIKI